MRLDIATMRRIAAIAGRAGNTAFRQRKHGLIAEALRLREAGGNVDRFLANEEFDALRGKFRGGK